MHFSLILKKRTLLIAIKSRCALKTPFNLRTTMARPLRTCERQCTRVPGISFHRVIIRICVTSKLIKRGELTGPPPLGTLRLCRINFTPSQDVTRRLAPFTGQVHAISEAEGRQTEVTSRLINHLQAGQPYLFSIFKQPAAR